MMIISALFTALLAIPASSPDNCRLVDHASYTSPSGEWRLAVTPTDRLGRGPGDTEVQKRVDESWMTVWSQRLDFTLSPAGITDQGIVAGYGVRGEVTATSGGASWVCALGQEGGLLWSDSKEIEGGPTSDPCAPSPVKFAMATGPDRVLIDGFDMPENLGGDWRTYGVLDGAQSRDFEPEQPFSDQSQLLVSLEKVTALPGTELLLGLWKVGFLWDEGGKGRGGLGVSVMNAKGESLWEKRWMGDYTLGNEDRFVHDLKAKVIAHGLIVVAGSTRQFKALNLDSRSYETFKVHDEVLDPTGITVVPMGSALVEGLWPEPVELPFVELPLINETKLVLSETGFEDSDCGSRSPTTLGSRERVSMKAGVRGYAQAYGAEGQLEFVLVPRRGRKGGFSRHLAQINSSGEVLVPLKSGARTESGEEAQFAVFTAEGVRQGTRTLLAQPIWFDPRGNGYWTEDLRRVDRAGRVWAHLELGEARTRLGRNVAVAANEKGDLAIRDQSFEGVELYDNMGSFSGRLITPGVPSDVERMSMAGDWMVSVTPRKADSAYITRISTGETFRFVLPWHYRGAEARSFWIAPGGDQLLVASASSLALLRFALPK